MQDLTCDFKRQVKSQGHFRLIRKPEISSREAGQLGLKPIGSTLHRKLSFKSVRRSTLGRHCTSPFQRSGTRRGVEARSRGRSGQRHQPQAPPTAVNGAVQLPGRSKKSSGSQSLKAALARKDVKCAHRAFTEMQNEEGIAETDAGLCNNILQCMSLMQLTPVHLYAK